MEGAVEESRRKSLLVEGKEGGLDWISRIRPWFYLVPDTRLCLRWGGL